MDLYDLARIRRFTADEVLRMLDVGILYDGEPYELLDGALVVKEAQGPVHSALVAGVAFRLGKIFDPIAHVRSHSPIHTGRYSMPEPDVVVVRGTFRDYLEHLPTGEQALFAIEFSWSTLRLDRAKAPIYGSGHVPVYWIVDVQARRVEVRCNPDPAGRYQDVSIFGEQDVLELPERAERIRVAELLP